MNRIVTRLPLGAHRDYEYPHATTVWTKDRDGMEGWRGLMSIWLDHSRKHEREWTASATISIPAQSLTIMVEPCSSGAWRMHSIPASDITIQTLWLVSALTLEVVQTHPEWSLGAKTL